MTNDEILKQLTELFREILDQPDLVLSRETTAKEVSGWDSVTHINVIVGAEMRFRIKFRTAELDDMGNIGDLVDLIAGKVNK
jgi:acyl carrier protein